MRLPGVRFLDHTADVGMDVEAHSLEALLHRAALGMLALLRGEEDVTEDVAQEAEEEADADPPVATTRAVSLDLAEESGPALLSAWLRELLFLHEVERRDYAAFTADRLDRWRFAGVVWTRAGGHAVREIKGVTYHGLLVEEEEEEGRQAGAGGQNPTGEPARLEPGREGGAGVERRRDEGRGDEGRPGEGRKARWRARVIFDV